MYYKWLNWKYTLEKWCEFYYVKTNLTFCNTKFVKNSGRFYGRQLSWVEGEVMVKFLLVHVHRHVPRHMRKEAAIYTKFAGEEPEKRPPWQHR